MRKLVGEINLWLPDVIRVANDPATDTQIRAVLQTRLQQAIDLTYAGNLVGEPLPGSQVSIRDGHVVIAPNKPPRSPITLSGQHAGADAKLLYAVALACGHPTITIGRRLRRCDWGECGKFFIARANHQRSHHFCTEEHRRAYDITHRDPKRAADYMREYRRAKTRREKKRKGR